MSSVRENTTISDSLDVADEQGRTALHRFALEGDIEEVKRLLGTGEIDSQGTTPLHFTPGTLTSPSTSVNLPDNEGQTPLHLCVSKGHLEVVETLIRHGALVNSQNDHIQAPLLVTVTRGQIKVAEIPIKTGAEVNKNQISKRQVITEQTDSQAYAVIPLRQTPLHIGVFNGSLEMVETLLNAGANVNAKDIKGLTPLHLAAYQRHKEIVEKLIQADAEMNTQQSKDDYFPDVSVNNDIIEGQTPLHIGASMGSTEIVTILIERGAEVNIQTKSGYTPLHFGAANNHTQIVETLVNASALINTLDCEGNTPLHLSVFAGHKEVAKLFLDRGARINHRNNMGITPLLMSAWTGNQNMFEFLVQQDAGAEQKRTILHNACSFFCETYEQCQNCKRIIVNLVSMGFDVNAVDSVNRTALHLICTYRCRIDKHCQSCKEIAEVLIKSGASVNIKDLDGMTPLMMYARKFGTPWNVQRNAKHDFPPHIFTETCGNFITVALQRATEAHVNCENIDGKTPPAAYDQEGSGHLVMRVLLNNGAEVNVQDMCKNTPLRYFCKENDIEAIQLLLSHEASVTDDIDVRGLTLLHCAVDANGCKVQVIEMLIKSGCSVNEKDQMGRTPLHDSVGASHCNLQVIEMLIKSGCSVNEKDQMGRTPLHASVRASHCNLQVIEMLIKSGCSVNEKDQMGRTPLHDSVGASHCNLQVIEMLIKSGCSVNEKDKMGQSPLHDSFNDWSNVSSDVVKLLLERGALVNAPDNNGDTPLHKGVLYHMNNIEAIKVLLASGAKVNSVNKFRETALHYCARPGKKDCAQLLLQNGARAYMPNFQGQTPLSLLQKYDVYSNNIEFITLLEEAEKAERRKKLKEEISQIEKEKSSGTGLDPSRDAHSQSWGVGERKVKSADHQEDATESSKSTSQATASTSLPTTDVTKPLVTPMIPSLASGVTTTHQARTVSLPPNTSVSGLTAGTANTSLAATAGATAQTGLEPANTSTPGGVSSSIVNINGPITCYNFQNVRNCAPGGTIKQYMQPRSRSRRTGRGTSGNDFKTAKKSASKATATATTTASSTTTTTQSNKSDQNVFQGYWKILFFLILALLTFYVILQIPL